MKILIFNWRDLKHSWAGGGEIYIFEQAKRWVKMGHQVTVFCGEDIEKKLPQFEIYDKINIYRKGGRYSLYFWAIWYYLFKFKGKFDVIVDIENGIPFFTPLFTSVPKACFVYHVHGNQFFYEISAPFSYIGYIIEKFIFPMIYKNVPIIAISKTTKKQLVQNGFKKSNIQIVHSGIVDSRRNKFILKKKYRNPTILYLGRIKKYKRVDMLVHIFPQILTSVPNARLVIAGWGTEASQLADIIMKSPYRRKIDLLGPVTQSEKAMLLSKCWLFVNPSIGEGWSIAVIEANTYGTPAISFRVPGLSESIQHNRTGLLASNEKDFINKICLILKDKKLCYKLGVRAKKRSEKFSWDKSSLKNLSILKNLLKK